MTMWLNQYLRQDSEKEKAQQQQLAMEAGVHYNQQQQARQQQQQEQQHSYGPCPASPGLQQVVPTSGFDPRVPANYRPQSYRDEGTSPLHDMPGMATRLALVPHTVRQDSTLSVVSDWDSIPSPTSFTTRDRFKSATDSEYLDNDLNEVKNQSPASSTDNLSSNRTLKCCMFSVISLGLVLFLAAFLLLFVTWHQNKRNALYMTDHSCAICDHLILSSDPLDDHRAEFSQRMEQGVLLCCATNATQFENLFNYMYERKARDRPPSPSFSAHTSRDIEPNPPSPEVAIHTPVVPPKGSPQLPDAPNTHAAHLFLDNHPNPARGMQIIRTWSDSMDTAFVRKGVDFDERRGRILIKDEGTYFVYVHLLYRGPRVDSESSSQEEYLRLFQLQIMRQSTSASNNGDQLLFEDLQAIRCDGDLHQSACYTSIAMGQVKLRDGDEIFVKVRNGDLLRTGKVSYFGLFRIE